MAETYKIKNTILTFNKIIYIATDGKDSNDGTINNPVATYHKAESLSANGDAIVFGKGEFHPTVLIIGSEYPDIVGLIGSRKNISVIGQGYETVIIADFKYKGGPDGDRSGLFYGPIKVYKLNCKVIPRTGSNVSYENCIINWSNTMLYNVAIENISPTYVISILYFNGAIAGTLKNCIIKTNGRYTDNWAGALIKSIADSLFDCNNISYKSSINNLIRPITEEDLSKGNSEDLSLKGIGVYRGEFSWNLPNSLYIHNDEAYGVVSNVFSKLSDNWSLLSAIEKENIFLLNEKDNVSMTDLAPLHNFKVLYYQNADSPATCIVKAVPKDQLILPKGLLNIESFESIDKISLASNTTNNGVLKILVTNDLSNYKTYDFVNNTWQNIDHTNMAEVLAQGINVSDIQNITRDSWDIITSNKSGIGFAYLLKMEDSTDVCEVDKISLTVDMKGAWEKSIHGSDYKYGYPSNKTLRVKLLANGDYKVNYSEGEKKI